MKINLLYNSNNLLSGYLNIDPLSSEDDIQSGKKVQGNIFDLNWAVEDAECTSIVAEDIINYVPAENIAQVLDNWVRKLRHNGTIIITGVDLYEVCRGINGRYIDLENANQLFYGETGEKKSILSGSDLTRALEECGLKIIKNRYNSYKYTIEAERP
jgi:hypothetical protein